MTEITKAEVTLIARDAATEAVDRYNDSLPVMLKPTMYEVAENVASQTEKTFIKLFSKVIGADVLNDDHVRDFHKDIYYLRDKRLDSERMSAALKTGAAENAGKLTLTAIFLGALALLGIKWGGH